MSIRNSGLDVVRSHTSPTPGTANGAIGGGLRKVCGATMVFNTVLGPEANNAHLNHFHLDLAERVQHTKICE